LSCFLCFIEYNLKKEYGYEKFFKIFLIGRHFNIPKILKYVFLYILVYFIVDFGTGFNWDFKYWISVGGPILGAIVYSLSGLFFGYLIFRKNIKEKWLFIIATIYGLALEFLFFKNHFLVFPNVFLGIPIVAAIYSLIVFAPKWIVEKSVRKNIKKSMPLLIIWVFFAISAYFFNPHQK